ncbi:hypothetical protein VT98_14332 [Candidatus Electrothrix communis]|uniref:Uncharacterized protein n=1 Tax=Candidatus Electrothrix communis TaxID=1859133 RepID=A0A3S3QP16_9BACT|nr:hypothetical protein VT98_14332 [Candidatus Electrothrix communis]
MNPTPEQKSPHSFRDRVGQVNSLLPAMLAFAVPLSTSAVSVLAILILLLWLIEADS